MLSRLNLTLLEKGDFKMKFSQLLTLTVFIILFLTLSDNIQAAAFTVTGTGDSGAGSFRQAILDANANPGQDTVMFNVGTGVQTITLLTPLPDVSDPLIIDGTTQPGFTGTPLIVLNGGSISASGDVYGLH